MSIVENIKDILFFDIETVPGCKTYDDLDEILRYHWDKKSAQIDQNMLASDSYLRKGGIYSEFGKVVCISCAFLYHNHDGVLKIRMKSFYGHDEKKILRDFLELIDKYFYKKSNFFCGHNIKEFDIPFILRRALINDVAIPRKLNIAGKKPWEVNFLIDTMELWKFGDYKSYISLDLMHLLLTGESAKSSIDGSQVCHYYYELDELDSIVTYCEQDVIATVKLYTSLARKMNGLNINVVFDS